MKHIANDTYGSPYRGTNESDDTVFMNVMVDENKGSSREKELNLDTLISFVEKGNLNKIKEIALEIMNDESIDINSEEI